jgi:hypothetical protein
MRIDPSLRFGMTPEGEDTKAAPSASRRPNNPGQNAVLERYPYG